MNRFWKVLLLAGLIMAFSMPALAVDLKISGSYYASGWYVDNHELAEHNKDSKAFISQRLRVQPVLQIADGLTLTTRFDSLEKKWGDRRWKSGGFQDNRNRTVEPVGVSSNSGYPKEQENIEIERSYVTFKTRMGIFDVGYQQGSSLFGTSFLDSDESIGRIKYALPLGQFALILSYEKLNEYMSTNAFGDSNKNADDDAYAIGGIAKFKGGEAGLIYKYIDLASKKPETAGAYRSTLHVIDPYVKMKAGAVNVEAEAYFIGGKLKEWENSVDAHDVDAEAFGGYVKAQVDMGSAYAGGMFVYMSGDDSDTEDEQEGGFMPVLNWGENFNPCLILWNYAYNNTWVGNLTGNATGAGVSGWMDNARFIQIYGGIKPDPKLNIKGSVSYAVADEKPANFKHREYGTELDVTAAYKIYDNLEYKLSAAYLFAGNYFKGATGNKVDDNYLLTHQVTLTF